MKDKITFSFGENWMNYLIKIDDLAIEDSKSNLTHWLDKKDIIGKSIIDVGSGSGLSSLAFYRLGAGSILSFDFDENSVQATKTLWEKEGKPENWIVLHGSVLEIDKVVKNNSTFDIVYSWGVLHHTGSMMQAINNCLPLVRKNGKLWISLYQKGPKYQKHLNTKIKYNSASSIGKKLMIYNMIVKMMIIKIINFENPLRWNEKRLRGMNAYNDIIDWLGGLPYEVASEDEVLNICRKSGFILDRIKVAPEGGCSNYVFSKP